MDPCFWVGGPLKCVRGYLKYYHFLQKLLGKHFL